MTSRSSCLGLAALCAMALFGPQARAQATEDKVQAETLFNDGRSLLKDGKLPEACSKLAASHKLDPAVGTLFSLADCFERRALTASAWVTYREASSLAASRGDDARRALAETRAAALAPKLSKLVIALELGADVSGLTVSRDGAVVAVETFGSQVPIDPGKHTLEARAPGRKPWSSSIEVAPEGALATAKIPVLEVDPTASQGAGSPPVGPTPGALQQPVRDIGVVDVGSTQRVLGLVVGGIGVVGLAAGTFLGLSAKSKWSEVTARCPDARCPDKATEDSMKGTADDASRFGTLSSISFAVGGAALVTGAVVYLTAPRKIDKAVGWKLVPVAGTHSTGLLMTGSF